MLYGINIKLPCLPKIFGLVRICRLERKQEKILEVVGKQSNLETFQVMFDLEATLINDSLEDSK